MKKRLGTILLLGVLLFPLLASARQGKIYYVKKGIKYHIGDNKYAQSEDALFIDTYPGVGPEWVQYFKVDRADKVKVHVDHIWGVDDCGYCKILISIDDWDMGRLYGENNHKPFDTPTELAMDVVPGKIYKLKIASLGRDEVDDFVIEDVSVETDANVIFIDEPKIGTCDRLKPCNNWQYATEDGKPAMFTLSATLADFTSSSTVARIAGGEALEFGFRISQRPISGDLVKQPMEILLGEEKKSGWVLSFEIGRAHV
jgi:hypothetical protein